LPSSDLYSHTGRPLEEHLTGVANLAELFFEDKIIAEQKNLTVTSRMIGLSHDLGKATGFFQEYLYAEDIEKKRIKNRPETSHGLFSAVCAFHLVKEYLKRCGYNDFSYYPLFAFEVVRRHHGDLRDLMEETVFDEEDRRLLNKQLDNINAKKFDILARHLFEAGLPIILTKEVISQWINGVKRELRSYKKAIRNSDGEASNYLILNLLYSILIDADKSDVVVRRADCFERTVIDISQDIVDIYKSQRPFQNSPINPLRESAYNEILSNKIDLNKKLYSINLPTGIGKTIISLAFSLKLRDQIKAETQSKHVPRIIYALPFLSIIEQNVDVFKNILNASGISPHSNILLKHHHLSEVFYQRDKDEEFESELAKIMIEGWNSEIVVSTFVQLFHTLVSNKNKSLRKFHRLNNSIIILDEVQSIPIKYWLLVKEMFQLLSEKLNLYVVFVTATEPLIFERKDLVRLVESKKYFKKMNRVVIKPLIDKDMTLKELYETFSMEDNKRYLFIFNTISSARRFYEMIDSKYKNISFLSTHIVPKERLLRIEGIKKGRYRIVVATQLVEAGVDIDFDIVVRDIAPLDSINQAAGRCNRNNLIHNKGTVYVVSLKDDNGRRFSSYIYDPVLLDITRRILNKYQDIKEERFLELVNDYYMDTSEKKAQKESKEVLEAILKLRYDTTDKETTAIADFKLIDKDYSKKDVFIEIDDFAIQVWHRYMELREIKDIFERKKKFDTIKADFYQYIISIPTNVENVPSQVGDLCYVNNTILSDYYDFKTGFITRDDRSLVIW